MRVRGREDVCDLRSIARSAFRRWGCDVGAGGEIARTLLHLPHLGYRGTHTRVLPAYARHAHEGLLFTPLARHDLLAGGLLAAQLRVDLHRK